MENRLTGGCLCGAVRYTMRPEPGIHYYCHCTDCRRYSGAAYHAAIAVSADALEFGGALVTWEKTADSGRTIARHTCEKCSSHLFTSPWPEVTRYSVKAGSLDEPSRFNPEYEIWTASRVSWASPAEELRGFPAGFGDAIEPLLKAT